MQKTNNLKKLSKKILAISCVVALAGCAATGKEHAADAYDADKLNQVQITRMVNILSILPAKINLDNSEQKKKAQAAGAAVGGVTGAIVGYNLKNSWWGHTATGAAVGAGAGAAAGSMVDDKVQVEGVTLSYKDGENILSSTQVGKACQFKTGPAAMITTEGKETRIQPNAECPKETK